MLKGLSQYKKTKPRVSVDENDLPAIKDWEVGQTYTVTAKVKMVSQSRGDEYADYSMDGSEPKPKTRATLKFLSITPSKESVVKKKGGKMLMRVKTK